MVWKVFRMLVGCLGGEKQGGVCLGFFVVF